MIAVKYYIISIQRGGDMEFIAHIKNGCIQTVSEHSLNTAELCECYASSFECGNIGRIQGLLHDAGKLTIEFNSYIKGESGAARGSIDHSYAGARYLDEISLNCKHRKAAQLAARTIISHHGLHVREKVYLTGVQPLQRIK